MCLLFDDVCKCINIGKRLQAYVRLSIRTRSVKPAAPSGYSEYQDELEMYTTIFGRIISYNHSIFGDYLKEILTKYEDQELSQSSTEASSSDTNVSKVVNTASDPVVTKDNE